MSSSPSSPGWFRKLVALAGEAQTIYAIWSLVCGFVVTYLKVRGVSVSWGNPESVLWIGSWFFASVAVAMTAFKLAAWGIPKARARLTTPPVLYLSAEGGEVEAVAVVKCQKGPVSVKADGRIVRTVRPASNPRPHPFSYDLRFKNRSSAVTVDLENNSHWALIHLAQVMDIRGITLVLNCGHDDTLIVPDSGVVVEIRLYPSVGPEIVKQYQISLVEIQKHGSRFRIDVSEVPSE